MIPILKGQCELTPLFEIPSIHLSLIHGEKSKLTPAERLPHYNPGTGEIIGTIQTANAKDLEQAIHSAAQGFKIWSQWTGLQRGRALYQAAQLLKKYTNELAYLETLDTGKPIQESITVDIPSATEALEYFAGLASSIHGEHYNFGQSFAYTRREPLGICAGIGAWNFPLQIASWKSGPALACGNAMIYKPSELTPLTTLRLAEIYLEAGIPPGVFNVLLGDGTVGKLLCEHPKIRKISLTGSVKTGQKVMSLSAPTLKHTTLELGGKSPLIIFNDTSIHSAVLGAVQANFLTQGEICSNGTRVFIQEEQYDAFVEALITHTQNLKIGNPFCKTTQIGALISAAHRDKVLNCIAAGQREGATLAFGGKIPAWSKSDNFHQGGYYIEPAIFTDCQDSMTLVQEEIFGPVMSILTFKTENEVIERANQSPYGLAAGIYTRDIQRAHRMAAQLEVGICWINNYNITPVEIPFGGTKLSGLGRENGPDVIQHYTQIKTVYVEQNF